MATFAAAATSGPAGSLAIIAGLNRPVAAGSATATPVSAHGVAVDGSGNIYIADPENDVVEEVTPGGTLSIIAGNGHAGTPTPGPATSSRLNHPDAVAVDSSGNVYIADTNNNEVEEVSGGTLSIFAGTGHGGAPTPGPATSSNLNSPAGVAVDSSGNVYIADSGNSEVEKVSSGTLSIVAGTGTSGTPTPGPATSSDLNHALSVAAGGGNVYIADTNNQVVEEVSGGTLSIIAGTGTMGAPTPGTATSSDLSNPAAVAVDSSGNVYIADRGNDLVEQVTSGGSLSILAGSGTLGGPTPGTATSSALNSPTGVAVDTSGGVYIADGAAGVVAKVASGVLSIPAGVVDFSFPTAGPASSSALSNVEGVAVDRSGNIYIADPDNNVIEKVTPSGTLSVIAGTGQTGNPRPGLAVNSPLNHPDAVAVDSSGNVYIADTNNSGVEKVTPGGTLSVIAGTGAIGAPTPGLGTHSDLNHPSGVAVDSSGNVYIADTGNNEIEKVTPSDTLSIIAGTGTRGAPTPGSATGSDLAGPFGVAVDSSGNVYIADRLNQVIEKVTGGNLSIIAGTGTSGAPTPGTATGSDLFNPSGVAVDGGGNVYIGDSANNEVEKVTSGGVLSIIVGTSHAGPPTPGPASSSNLDTPVQIAVDRYGNLYIADSGNSDVEEAFGLAQPFLDQTSTSLACSPATVGSGAATTCTATVSDTASTAALTPTGTVSFSSSPKSGSFSSSGACQLAGSSGVASCHVSFSPSASGSYTVTAGYGGDTQHAASSGGTTIQASSAASHSGRASVSQIRVAGTAVSLRVRCAGSGSCAVRLKLTVQETLKHGKVVAIAAKAKTTKRTVTVGSGSVTVRAGSSKIVKVSLNAAGRALLAKHSPLKAKLTVTQSGRTVHSATVTFKKAKPKKH